jgi:hypothetical protein
VTEDDDNWVDGLIEKARRHVAEFGYHLTYASEDPPICYSAGLERTWEHPELLVYGLDFDDAKTVLTGLVMEISKGARWSHGDVDVQTFSRPIAFVEIPNAEYSGRMSVTIMVYEGYEFRALQVVTPDAEGRFPWDDGCDPAHVAAQPVLGRAPR